MKEEGNRNSAARALFAIAGMALGIMAATLLTESPQAWSLGERIFGGEQRTGEGTSHTGRIKDRGTRIELALDLYDSRGRTHGMTFDLDTGFTGQMCLGEDRAHRKLGLAPHRKSTYNTADGRDVETDMYWTRVLWHGRVQEVEACGNSRRNIIGMGMIQDSNVVINSRRKTVTIMPKRKGAQRREDDGRRPEKAP